jgi:hypothetical protein
MRERGVLRPRAGEHLEAFAFRGVGEAEIEGHEGDSVGPFLDREKRSAEVQCTGSTQRMSFQQPACAGTNGIEICHFAPAGLEIRKTTFGGSENGSGDRSIATLSSQRRNDLGSRQCPHHRNGILAKPTSTPGAFRFATDERHERRRVPKPHR